MCYKEGEILPPRIFKEFQRKSWLAGCEVANAVFCYPCLLFHPEGTMTDSTAWTAQTHPPSSTLIAQWPWGPAEVNTNIFITQGRLHLQLS